MNILLNHTSVPYLTAALLLLPAALNAAFRDDIDALLSGKMPDGVVFEVVSGNANALQDILPKVNSAAERLHKKWPELDIVVVSHGKEQFALTKDNAGKHAAVQKQVIDLGRNNNVSFHVCGAYASMHNVSEEDFPEHINVSAHGPEQIRDYKALGYRVIRAR